MATYQSQPSTCSRSTIECDSSNDSDGFAELTYQSAWSNYPMISDDSDGSVELQHSKFRIGERARFSFELDPVISVTDPMICAGDDVDIKFFDRISLAVAGAVCRSVAAAQRRGPPKDMEYCTVVALASRHLPIDPIVVGKPFAIEIDRYFGASVGLGISRVSRDDTRVGWYVKCIKEDGLVHAWNKAHPNNMVCVWDRVLSINGHAIAETLYAELRKNTALRVELIREIEQPRKSMAKDRHRSGKVEDPQVAELKRLQLAGLIPKEGMVYAKPIQKCKEKRKNMDHDSVAQKALRERQRSAERKTKHPETPKYQLPTPPMKTLRKPQVELCVAGCGRHAAKGRAQGGEKLCTCCQGGPSGQAHDARCVDTVPSGVDQTMLNQSPTKPKNPMRTPGKLGVKDANSNVQAWLWPLCCTMKKDFGQIRFSGCRGGAKRRGP